MGYFHPYQRGMLIRSSSVAEYIVAKETKWHGRELYDVKTLAEASADEREDGVFAKLVRFDSEDGARPPIYRVCLQDEEIFEFVRRQGDVDLPSLLTFIMTHELVHIHRFSTGKADFFETDKDEEEAYVDSLTRLFLAKNPMTGLKNVLSILDKVEAAPLYSFSRIIEQRRSFNAYL
jgi:hypothetical protein